MLRKSLAQVTLLGYNFKNFRGKIKSGDAVLPARSTSPQVSKMIRLRCVTTPDEAQKVLLNRLGLRLPQRLRRIDEVVQM